MARVLCFTNVNSVASLPKLSKINSTNQFPKSSLSFQTPISRCPEPKFQSMIFKAASKGGKGTKPISIISAQFYGNGRKATKRDIVIPEPDFRLPVVLLGVAGISAYQDNFLPAATIGLLGLLLLFQTTRVRFVFDEEALEVNIGDQLEESGENVFVGGKNRWKYSTFVNWELWWPNFPILVYFKETQTKPEGQIHFFPVIFNGKQLYDVLVERAGPSKTSAPK